MRLPAIAACLMTLSGCSTMPLPVPTVPRQKPATAMVPCQPLPLLTDPTAAGLARWAMDTSERYGDCRANHQRLRDWIDGQH